MRGHSIESRAQNLQKSQTMGQDWQEHCTSASGFYPSSKPQLRRCESASYLGKSSSASNKNYEGLEAKYKAL